MNSINLLLLRSKGTHVADTGSEVVNQLFSWGQGFFDQWNLDEVLRPLMEGREFLGVE